MRPYLILLTGVCGVASAALFARVGLRTGLSAIELSAWRLTLAGGALILWSLFAKPGGQAVQIADRLKVTIAGIFLALHFAFWIASLQYVSIARSTLLVSTAPIWAGQVGLF